MKRAVCAIALVLAGVSMTSASPAGAGRTVDWNDRSTVDVTLPSGWHLVACDGNAPYLCATDPAGSPDGSILLVTTDVAFDEDISTPGVEAHAAELVRDVEADRRAVCGSDFDVEAHPVDAVTVAGMPGHRYGFTLRDSAGTATEEVILHVAVVNGQRFLTSTAFSDPAACPGEDPERDEFAMSAGPAIEPYLDELVADSKLPSDFDAGPLCLARKVSPIAFEDVTAGNSHRSAIGCVTWLELFYGRSPQSFDPESPVTRGEVAAVAARLVRATGRPLTDAPGTRFDDTAGSVHASDIDALTEAGVLRGTGPRRFEPDGPATRSQATAMLVAAYEYAIDSLLFDAGVTFTDVRGIHADAISRAVTAGVVRGTNEGIFGSHHRMRRDQFATAVGRAANRLGGTAHLAAPPAG